MARNDRLTCRRSDAIRFFTWCRPALHKLAEKLIAADKREFESGRVPPLLFKKVRSAWSNQLKYGWPLEGASAVVAKALKNPEYFETWKRHPFAQMHTLPKRICRPAFCALRARGEELHADFFADDGDARLANYLEVWQSQRRASQMQVIQVWGYRRKQDGGASVGQTEIDVERMMLSEAEAYGSAMHVTGLLPFLRSLWEVETPKGTERLVIPNPDLSEKRLIRFLIRLGRALASKKKRRELPDWSHGVDQTERFIVEGWCERIVVDGEYWPPLCIFTTPTLVRFLRRCNVKHCSLARKDARTIERAIQRLGLVRIAKGRVRHVERRGGRFYFS